MIKKKLKPRVLFYYSPAVPQHAKKNYLNVVQKYRNRCFANNNRAKTRQRKRSKGYNNPIVTGYVRDLTQVARHEKPVTTKTEN
jgi:hypothetical protein